MSPISAIRFDWLLHSYFSTTRYRHRRFPIDIVTENEKDKLSAGSAGDGWMVDNKGVRALFRSISDIPGLSRSEAYLTWEHYWRVFMVAVFMKELIDKVYCQYFYTLSEKLVHKRTIYINWYLVGLAEGCEPLREFFARNGVKFALSVLAFIFLLKMFILFGSYVHRFRQRNRLYQYRNRHILQPLNRHYHRLCCSRRNGEYQIWHLGGANDQRFTMAISNLFALIAVV